MLYVEGVGFLIGFVFGFYRKRIRSAEFIRSRDLPKYLIAALVFVLFAVGFGFFLRSISDDPFILIHQVILYISIMFFPGWALGIFGNWVVGKINNQR